MQEMNIDTYVDENGVLCLKMPPNLAGMEIKGRLFYQIYPAPSATFQGKKVDINTVRSICHQIRNLPNLDSRTPDEIIGYNQFGIPE